MRLGSLLSGIGGVDLGFQHAGWNVAWQVEIDHAKRAILSEHWRDVMLFRDVLLLPQPFLSKVECIAAEFPTHEYRHAHPLWEATKRIVQRLQPEFVVIPAIVATAVREDGKDADALARDIAALGYQTVGFALGANKTRWAFERYVTVGYRTPAPPAFLGIAGKKLSFLWDDEPDEHIGGLDYGAALTGDLDRAEQQWGFPNGWTRVPGVSPQQRADALMEAMSVEVAWWLGEQLGEAIRANLSEKP